MPFDHAECPDTLERMLKDEYCLASLSKNAKGKAEEPDPDRRDCAELDCTTLVTSQTMILDLSTNQGCEDRLGRLLSGRLVVKELVHAFATDPSERGFHSGEFEWESNDAVVRGELSGMTNTGLLRAAPFEACEKCKTARIDTGRFCGVIEEAKVDELKEAKVLGAYRLRFGRVTTTGFLGSVLGTWEGVVVRPCRR